MHAKIKTTGDLREFLADTILNVKSGQLELDRASRITKLAGQINESFYAEIKAAKVRAEARQVVVQLGQLALGESS